MEISIVMTVYNGEEFLKESVQSILDQTYRDFEFIIVDDCSTDRTPQLLAEFKDSRVKVYRLKENKGQTYSLNYGISLARGSWIFRQDADDVSLPTRIEKQLSFLKDHPDTIAVGTMIQAIPSKRTQNLHSVRAIEWSNSLLTREDIKKFRYIAPPVVHGSVAFSKDAFLKAGGYDESYSIGQDLDLWIRLLEIGAIEKVPEVLYCYRVDPDSMSRKDETKTCFESLTISTKHIKRMLEKELQREPVILMSGPERGCEYFQKKIAAKHGITVLQYIDEELGTSVLLEKGADAILILDGKYSEQHVTELEQAGCKFNREVFRLWNIYIESEKNPFASVIVPCFNCASSIRHTLLSLKNQTYPFYEIIVVDDASTDHSVKILEDLDIDNLIIIRHSFNRGAAKARNTGAAYAKGEVLIFCDSDFIVPPWYVESHAKSHDVKERKVISGMGHWHYMVTSKHKWSSYEQEFVKEFYQRPSIQDRLEEYSFLRDDDIFHWDLERFKFIPEYLKEWVQITGDIYDYYGEEMEHFHLPWLSFCTGNLSLRKEYFMELGGFDVRFRRLEDWEFGYRFYKSGGTFTFKKDCEAYQQLGPISPHRRNLQLEAYRLFCRKHTDFEVHLISLLLFNEKNFRELSTIYEEHQMLKQEELYQSLTVQMEKLLFQYAMGEKSASHMAGLDQFPLIRLEYREWADLYQTLHARWD
jgi:glycosyltransferase involved in cell wall biosynthesis